MEEFHEETVKWITVCIASGIAYAILFPGEGGASGDGPGEKQDTTGSPQGDAHSIGTRDSRQERHAQRASSEGDLDDRRSGRHDASDDKRPKSADQSGKRGGSGQSGKRGGSGHSGQQGSVALLGQRGGSGQSGQQGGSSQSGQQGGSVQSGQQGGSGRSGQQGSAGKTPTGSANQQEKEAKPCACKPPPGAEAAPKKKKKKKKGSKKGTKKKRCHCPDKQGGQPSDGAGFGADDGGGGLGGDGGGGTAEPKEEKPKKHSKPRKEGPRGRGRLAGLGQAIENLPDEVKYMIVAAVGILMKRMLDD